MDKKEFAASRAWLQKTQQEMADLLGLSVQAVRSFEQGWRNIPPHAERQMLFLLGMRSARRRKPRPCWTVMKCSSEMRNRCPAWEFQAGTLCWFINGTLCRGGKAQKDWATKMKICRQCPMLRDVTGMRYSF